MSGRSPLNRISQVLIALVTLLIIGYFIRCNNLMGLVITITSNLGSNFITHKYFEWRNERKRIRQGNYLKTEIYGNTINLSGRMISTDNISKGVMQVQKGFQSSITMQMNGLDPNN